jgi:hypothetical protein
MGVVILPAVAESARGRSVGAGSVKRREWAKRPESVMLGESV